MWQQSRALQNCIVAPNIIAYIIFYLNYIYCKSVKWYLLRPNESLSLYGGTPPTLYNSNVCSYLLCNPLYDPALTVGTRTTPTPQ